MSIIRRGIHTINAGNNSENGCAWNATSRAQRMGSPFGYLSKTPVEVKHLCQGNVRAIKKYENTKQALNVDIEGGQGLHFCGYYLRGVKKMKAPNELTKLGRSCVQSEIKKQRKLKSKYSIVGRNGDGDILSRFSHGETLQRLEKTTEQISTENSSIDQSLMRFLNTTSVENITIFVISDDSLDEISSIRKEKPTGSHGTVSQEPAASEDPKVYNQEADLSEDLDDFVDVIGTSCPSNLKRSSKESVSTYVNSIPDYHSTTIANLTTSKDSSLGSESYNFRPFLDSRTDESSSTSDFKMDQEFFAFYTNTNDFASTTDMSEFGGKRNRCKKMFLRAVRKFKKKNTSHSSECSTSITTETGTTEETVPKKKKKRIKGVFQGIREARVWEWLREIPDKIASHDPSDTCSDVSCSTSFEASSSTATRTTKVGTEKTFSETCIKRRALHSFFSRVKKKRNSREKIGENQHKVCRRTKFTRILSSLLKKIWIFKPRNTLTIAMSTKNLGKVKSNKIPASKQSKSDVFSKKHSENALAEILGKPKTAQEFPSGNKPKSLNLKIYRKEAKQKSRFAVYRSFSDIVTTSSFKNNRSNPYSESRIVACPAKSYERLSRKPYTAPTYEKTWKVQDRVITERPTTDPGVKKPSIAKRERNRQRVVDDRDLRTEALVNKSQEDLKKMEEEEKEAAKKKRKKPREAEEDTETLDSETKREIVSSADQQDKGPPVRKVAEQTPPFSGSPPRESRKSLASPGIPNCPCNSAKAKVFKVFIHDNHGCEIEIIRSPQVAKALTEQQNGDNDKIVAHSLVLQQERKSFKKRHKKRDKVTTSYWCNAVHVDSIRPRSLKHSAGSLNPNSPTTSSLPPVPCNSSSLFRDEINESTEKIREKYLSGIYSPSTSAMDSYNGQSKKASPPSPLWQCLKSPSNVSVRSSEVLPLPAPRSRRLLFPLENVPSNCSVLRRQSGELSIGKPQTKESPSGTVEKGEGTTDSTDITMEDLIALLSSTTGDHC